MKLHNGKPVFEAGDMFWMIERDADPLGLNPFTSALKFVVQRDGGKKVLRQMAGGLRTIICSLKSEGCKRVGTTPSFTNVAGIEVTTEIWAP